MEEHDRERYSLYDFEVDCDHWYMNNCLFWNDNYFYLLFDYSTPHYLENIVERIQEPYMNTIFQFSHSVVLMCYVDDHLDRNGSTYLYSLD
jgi:hypothetical protein